MLLATDTRRNADAVEGPKESCIQAYQGPIKASSKAQSVLLTTDTRRNADTVGGDQGQGAAEYRRAAPL
jgi:hypothetical protein